MDPDAETLALADDAEVTMEPVSTLPDEPPDEPDILLLVTCDGKCEALSSAPEKIMASAANRPNPVSSRPIVDSIVPGIILLRQWLGGPPRGVLSSFLVGWLL